MTGEPAPVVSVILPVYNGERHVASALHSLLAQTFADWEAVIVNDGSTDGTAGVLQGFAHEPRLTVITQENRGLAASRNRGLAAARGEYVAFLDADDRWHPHYLAELIAALNSAPQAVAAFAGWRYITEAGQPLPQAVLPFEGQTADLGEALLWRNAILPSALVGRRAAVAQAGGFDEQFAACEDWDLWLRLQPLGPFVAVPRVLLDYRTHPGSMTEDVENIERERLKLNGKHLGPPTGDPQTWPFARRRAVGYTYFMSALGFFRQRDQQNGLARVRRAVECWPGLLEQDEFYYELGCAYQGRGVRGTSVSLDVEAGAALLRHVLFESLPPGARSPQARWGHAALVLARLAALAGNRAVERRFAWQAFRHAPLRQKAVAMRAVARALVPQSWTRLARSLWPGRAALPGG